MYWREEMSQKFVFTCVDCGKKYSVNRQVMYLCPVCSSQNTGEQPPSGALKTVYDYPEIAKRSKRFKALRNNAYIDILPISDPANLPPLRIGNTPLYRFTKIDGKRLPYVFFIKDDSQNPTFSYKDRASALVSAYAKESGIDTIVAASTGNAGSSIAGICASQGQHAIVLVPEKAPLAKLSQIMMYGAKILPVKGTYDQAFDLSIALSDKHGWYNRNTGYNPFTIEGKKTAAFELYDQMQGEEIHRIFVSVGDGVIISGIYKGFEDLMELGFLEKMPVIVAVQAENSDNLVRNMETDTFAAKASHTIADSISVDVPRNFNMARKFLLTYGGEWISVSDDEIMEAASVMARNTGIFAEPAAAAAYAGLLKYDKEDKLPASTNNVVMSTGSGLKDLKALRGSIEVPEAIEPILQAVEEAVGSKKAVSSRQ